MSAGTDLRRPLVQRRETTREVDLDCGISCADRGAEERLAAERRVTLIPVAALKRTPPSRCIRGG
jgi:hypothetical protein